MAAQSRRGTACVAAVFVQGLPSVFHSFIYIKYNKDVIGSYFLGTSITRIVRKHILCTHVNRIFAYLGVKKEPFLWRAKLRDSIAQ